MSFISAAARTAAVIANGGAAQTGASVVSANSLEAAIKSLGNTMGKTGMASESLVDDIKEVGGAYGVLREVVKFSIGVIPNLIIGPFEDMLNQARRLTSQYVQAYSPNEARMLDLAMRDLNAVIGQILVPVTRLARDVFRGLGDAMDQLRPVISSIVDSYTSIVRDVFSFIFNLFKENYWIIEAFGIALRVLIIEPFKALIEIIKPVGNGLLLISRQIRELLGIEEFTGNARGRAFMQASTTSITGLGRRLQENAFGMGASPEERTAKGIGDLISIINGLPTKIATAIVNSSSQIAAGMAGKFALEIANKLNEKNVTSAKIATAATAARAGLGASFGF